ncbi:hypothetical protein [Mycobacteroides abscessus]|uniref:hypothetical protein n=1 Tax=Mycobacteroides abscessus TaxID=36809 RepID=UPI001F447C63|nr:hypothetical protein [Mycobacteroides abscessus]
MLPDEPMFGIDDPPLGIIDVNPPPEPKLDTGFEPPEGADGSDVGNDDDALPITSPEDAAFPTPGVFWAPKFEFFSAESGFRCLSQACDSGVAFDGPLFSAGSR